MTCSWTTVSFFFIRINYVCLDRVVRKCRQHRVWLISFVYEPGTHCLRSAALPKYGLANTQLVVLAMDTMVELKVSFLASIFVWFWILRMKSFLGNKCSFFSFICYQAIYHLKLWEKMCFLSSSEAVLWEKFWTAQVQGSQWYDLEAIHQVRDTAKSEYGKGEAERAGVVRYFVYKSRVVNFFTFNFCWNDGRKPYTMLKTN